MYIFSQIFLTGKISKTYSGIMFMFPIPMATGFIELLQRLQLVAVWCILGVSKWRILMFLIIVQMNNDAMLVLITQITYSYKYKCYPGRLQ